MKADIYIMEFCTEICERLGTKIRFKISLFAKQCYPNLFKIRRVKDFIF
jgi:hypothetical protein